MIVELIAVGYWAAVALVLGAIAGVLTVALIVAKQQLASACIAGAVILTAAALARLAESATTTVSIAGAFGFFGGIVLAARGISGD